MDVEWEAAFAKLKLIFSLFFPPKKDSFLDPKPHSECWDGGGVVAAAAPLTKHKFPGSALL